MLTIRFDQSVLSLLLLLLALLPFFAAMEHSRRTPSSFQLSTETLVATFVPNRPGFALSPFPPPPPMEQQQHVLYVPISVYTPADGTDRLLACPDLSWNNRTTNRVSQSCMLGNTSATLRFDYMPILNETYVVRSTSGYNFTVPAHALKQSIRVDGDTAQNPLRGDARFIRFAVFLSSPTRSILTEPGVQQSGETVLIFVTDAFNFTYAQPSFYLYTGTPQVVNLQVDALNPPGNDTAFVCSLGTRWNDSWSYDPYVSMDTTLGFQQQQQHPSVENGGGTSWKIIVAGCTVAGAVVLVLFMLALAMGIPWGIYRWCYRYKGAGGVVFDAKETIQAEEMNMEL